MKKKEPKNQKFKTIESLASNIANVIQDLKESNQNKNKTSWFSEKLFAVVTNALLISKYFRYELISNSGNDVYFFFSPIRNENTCSFQWARIICRQMFCKDVNEIQFSTSQRKIKMENCL